MEKFTGLLLFDGRYIDNSTKTELLRLVPELVHVRRAWTKLFCRRGCLVCHRKKVPYGAGGMCKRCQMRVMNQIRVIVREGTKGRDAVRETALLTREVDLAQQLLND